MSGAGKGFFFLKVKCYKKLFALNKNSLQWYME